MIRKFVVAACTTVALLAGSLAVADAAGGGTTAKQCGKNGWTLVQSGTGSSFTSQKQCAAYVRSGGVLYAPTATYSDTFLDADDPVTLTLAGFHPNTPFQFQLTEVIVGPTDWCLFAVGFPGFTCSGGTLTIINGSGSGPNLDAAGGLSFLSLAPPIELICVMPAGYTVTRTYRFTDSFGVSASASLGLTYWAVPYDQFPPGFCQNAPV